MSQILALAAPAVVLCGWFLRSRFGIAAVCLAAAAVSIGATFGAWAAYRWAESSAGQVWSACSNSPPCWRWWS